MSESTVIETPIRTPIADEDILYEVIDGRIILERPPMTAFEAMIAADVLYEVIDGRVVEKPAMGVYQGLVAAWLVRLMNTSAALSRLGRVVQEVLFKLDAARNFKRRPDVAFVSYERWPRGQTVPTGEAWDVIPDLAVEVVSPSNSADDLIDKLEEYFQAGVRLVWVIYPVRRKVYVYTSPTAVRILQPGDDLDGGLVLPGFRAAVKSLFDEDDGSPSA